MNALNSEWDRHTELTELGSGRYGVELDGGWSVGGGINGGYQMGVVGKAISAALPRHPDPFTLSAYFLSAGTAGPAEVEVRTLRSGKGSTTVAADLSQGGDVRLTTLATYGDLSALPADEHSRAVEPEFPPRDQCVPASMAPDEFKRVAPLMQRFEMLFDPACIGWALGKPSGEGAIRAWFRLNDEREADPTSLLMVLDALPPVTFDLGMPGWAPTMEFTAYVRKRPAPGWLKVAHRTRHVAGGMFEEDCEIWDSTGSLVAHSRQLAKLPRSAG